ncbi:hypothetical protein FISHEDRAFT_76394 [Fistulina hepatica ATCC 64428]|uniref:Uncharacterized protein n=1 Tax=Fistulina hepatica ATCC 64428 TaxID=1128425 RepID=A0A0D7A3D3_9AGAR|nr:hypothetical protein FISHEDRAFT_76394 [Fistulina hepatica ATCC 64428]
MVKERPPFPPIHTIGSHHFRLSISVGRFEVEAQRSSTVESEIDNGYWAWANIARFFQQLQGREARMIRTIHALIDAAPVLHVSFLPAYNDADPFPTRLHISPRLFNLHSPDGSPIRVAASSVDGLAPTPFNRSTDYRSTVVFGHAHPVTSDAEKLWALERITDKALPGRCHQTRIPPTRTELQSTGVLRVEIVTASAKMRAKGVVDELPDLKNEAPRERMWTGVVPMWMHYDEPASAESNMVDEVPGYIQNQVMA